jgi:hypothetical protein
MKRTETTRRLAKWTAWAARFESRFYRHAGPYHMALLLHVRNSRTSVLIEERWLRPILQVRPQIHWKTGGTSFATTNQVFNKQVNFLSHARAAKEAGRRPETVLAMLAAPASVESRERAQALTRVIDGTRREFGVLLERRFVQRRDTLATRSTERLVHRSERVERIGVSERTLTLRRDATAAMKSSIEASVLAKSRAVDDRRMQTPVAPAQPTMSAINVDQLADQVIRQIDRKVIARRERMGRI